MIVGRPAGVPFSQPNGTGMISTCDFSPASLVQIFLQRAMRFPAAVGLAAFFSLLAALSANAQDKPETTSEVAGWATACKMGSCSLTKSVAEKSSQQTFLSLSVLIEQDGRKPALLIALPLGTSLEPGVRVVLGEDVWNVPFSACFPNGCQALQDLSAAQLDLLRSSDSADIRFFAVSSEDPIAADVSLSGLGDALDFVQSN